MTENGLRDRVTTKHNAYIVVDGIAESVLLVRLIEIEVEPIELVALARLPEYLSTLSVWRYTVR
jgi:hypothetical protein